MIAVQLIDSTGRVLGNMHLPAGVRLGDLEQLALAAGHQPLPEYTEEHTATKSHASAPEAKVSKRSPRPIRRVMTAAQIIESIRRRVVKAKPMLVELELDRAQGALSTLCDLGLIDGITYIGAGRDLSELAQRRLAKLRS